MHTTRFQPGAPDISYPCTIAADGSPITLKGEPTLRASPITHVVTGKLYARSASKRTGMETPHQSGIL